MDSNDPQKPAMHEIPVVLNNCTDKNCQFRFNCANHVDNGSWKKPRLFTPEIFYEDQRKTFHCKTFGHAPMHGFADYPDNHHSLNKGFVPIKID